jgi:ribosomal protein RSM22 (predicted rRNA methylase)
MLPASLRRALDERLEGISRTALAERAAAISLRYRTGQRSAAAIRDATDALAYAIARMPATYAAVAAALDRLAEHWPEFSPSRLVDLGAGPGTATFAAREVWPSLSAVQQIEANAQFRSFSQALAAQAGIGGIAWTPGDLTSAPIAPADLAIAAYVLVELPEPAVTALVLRALESCRALVLVEPGTPAGFARIRSARDALIRAGARVLAPCPGEIRCAVTGTDWCHFTVRLARSRDHKLLKAADAPYEDEPFSYLVATRAEGPKPVDLRIIAEPSLTRGEISLRTCTPRGFEQLHIPRSDRVRYKAARKLDWGDGADGLE